MAMKRFLILSVLLWSVFSFACAKSPIDSLKQRLELHDSVDTIRVDLLNRLGYEYWITDPIQSELYGNEAIALADSLHYLPGFAFANRVVGVAHWARGNYATALSYLFEGLNAYQKSADSAGAGSMYNNIGLVYQDQRSYDLAQRYFEQALVQSRAIRSKSREAGALSNLGRTHLLAGRFAEADRIYQEVLQMNQALGRPYGIAESYSNLGELSLVRGQAEEALEHLFRSLSIRQQIPDLEGIALCQYFIGQAYLSQGKFRVAEKHLLEGRQTATQVGTRKWLTSIYEALKEMEVAQGNFPKALAYSEEFATRKDSLFDVEKSRQIAEMQTRYQTLQKEQKLEGQKKELALLREQARLQLFLWIGLLVGLLTTLIIGYLVLSRQRLKIRKNLELLAKNREISISRQALSQAELENARLQEMKLMQELEFKNKELTSYALNFIQKNELLESLKASISQLKKTQDQETIRKLGDLNRLVEQRMHIDKDWEDFKRHFEEVHKDFFRVLKESYPDLTNNELKLCTLLKLNMNLKEAANVMGISPDSVKTARYRLRKKFNLNRDDNLVDHLIVLEQNLLHQGKPLSATEKEKTAQELSLP
jgi:tetratricopeptide (TPR) repeat protein